MDTTEDLSARVLLRNILSSETPRTPVTRSKTRSTNETQSITRSRRSSAGSQTPQGILRRSLRHKMRESIFRKPPSPLKRRTVSAAHRRINTPGLSSTLFDEDDTPRHILKNILQTEPVKSPVIHEKALPQEPQEPQQPASANSTIEGHSLTSDDTSQLSLSNITFGQVMATAKGLRRKRPRRSLNVTDFKKRLKDGDEDGAEESAGDLSLSLSSSTTLSLKTPFVDVRTEKRGLRRRVDTRRKITEDDFGASLHLGKTRGMSGLKPAGQRDNDTTLGQSKLSEVDITSDIIGSNTSLFAQTGSAAFNLSAVPIQDKSTVLASLFHGEMDTSANLSRHVSMEDNAAAMQASNAGRSDEEGRIEESQTGKEGAHDAQAEEAGAAELEKEEASSQPEEEEASSQPEEEEAAAASEPEEEEASSQPEEEEAAAASEPEEEEASSQPEEEEASSQPEEEEASSQPEEEEAAAASEPEEEEASSQPEEEEASSQPEEEQASSQPEEEEAVAASEPEEEEASSQPEEEEAAAASEPEEEEVPADSKIEGSLSPSDVREEEEYPSQPQPEEADVAIPSQTEDENDRTSDEEDYDERAEKHSLRDGEHISQRSRRSEDGPTTPVRETGGDSPGNEEADPAEQEEESLDEEESDEDSEEIPMQTPAFVREKWKRLPLSQLDSPISSKAHPSSSTAAGAQPPKPKQVTKRKAGPRKRVGGLPKNYLMGVFRHFAKTKVSADVYPVLSEIMDKFFERMANDLETYALHAKRKTIEVEDAVLLLKRQGHVNDKVPVEVLIEKYLRMDQRRLLIPVATSGNVVVPKRR